MAAAPPTTSDEAEFVARLDAYPRVRSWLGHGERYELTRFVLLRLLGFVYSAAFASLLRQVVPPIGPRGLLPAAVHTASVLSASDSFAEARLAERSLFLLIVPSDGVWCGV